MLRALAHCHLKGVVLCDVKPDNFLFDRKGHDAVLKAIDLGLSRRFTPGQALRRAAGTVRHTPPSLPPHRLSPVNRGFGLSRAERLQPTDLLPPLSPFASPRVNHTSLHPRSHLAASHSAHVHSVAETRTAHPSIALRPRKCTLSRDP